MLFMGCKKYPDENEYDEYLDKHGGSSNASTDMERVCGFGKLKIIRQLIQTLFIAKNARIYVNFCSPLRQVICLTFPRSIWREQ